MTRFRLVLSEAARSIGANLSTTIAATMTVLIGMFLLGLTIALGTWVVSWSNHVKSQLEVKLYFVDGVSGKQVNSVGAYLGKDTRIKEYQFVSKTEALKRMKKKYPQLTANLPSNPLPASFEITPLRAENVHDLSRDLRAQKFKGVETVKDGQQTSKRIIQVGKVIWIVFLVMSSACRRQSRKSSTLPARLGRTLSTRASHGSSSRSPISLISIINATITPSRGSPGA